MAFESKIGTSDECEQFSQDTDIAPHDTRGWWYHAPKNKAAAREFANGDRRFNSRSFISFTRNPAGASQYGGQWVIRVMFDLHRSQGDNYTFGPSAIDSGHDWLKTRAATQIMVERDYCEYAANNQNHQPS